MGLSVCLSGCLSTAAVSVCLGHTNSCSFRLPLPGHGIRHDGSLAVLLFPPVKEVPPLDAPVPIEEGRQRGIPVLLRIPGEFIRIMRPNVSVCCSRGCKH